jgi:hypothetical protein
MAANLGAVAQLLEASLDPRQNKQGNLRTTSIEGPIMVDPS